MLPSHPSPGLPDRLLIHAWRVFLTCGHEMSRVHAGPVAASPATAGQGQTEANAAFQGHGRFSIIEPLAPEPAHVTPVGSESAYYLPVIPIIEGQSGTEELGHAAAVALKEHRGALIRGNGVVTTGASA